MKSATFRGLLAIAQKNGLEVVNYDIKTAFQHGDLKEEIYLVQPTGFAENDKENYVCELQERLNQAAK